MIHQSGLRPGEAEKSLPCDELLPNAEIVIDRATTLPATPEVVWPWLVQIGKDRAGWYFPRAIERFQPKGNRGSRTLVPLHSTLAVGDAVLDWGPGEPTLNAVVVEEPRTIGYESTRGRARLTWVLQLEPEGPTASRLHLRLKIDRTADWMTPIITTGGGVFDYLTIIGLFAGLKERLTTR